MTLIDRLRKVEPDKEGVTTRWYRNPDGPEAADEIERLRKALIKIVTVHTTLGVSPDAASLLLYCMAIAEVALKGEEV